MSEKNIKRRPKADSSKICINVKNKEPTTHPQGRFNFISTLLCRDDSGPRLLRLENKKRTQSFHPPLFLYFKVFFYRIPLGPFLIGPFRKLLLSYFIERLVPFFRSLNVTASSLLISYYCV
jgi:hypothetical protein